VEALQGPGETPIDDPQERVVVVSHQDVREQGELEAFAVLAEAVEKVLAVVISEEEVAAIAAVGGQVVDAWVEQARATWHQATVDRTTLPDSCAV
jgi:hypothetical protein